MIDEPHGERTGGDGGGAIASSEKAAEETWPDAGLDFRDLQRPTLTDLVTDKVRRAILGGDLRPGSVLRQERLAQELGVSRTPLKEALHLLDREGLVSISPSRGAVVVELTVEDAREILDVRELVDGLAARRLCGMGLSGDSLIRLEVLVRTMQDAAERNNKAKFLVANADFHLTLLAKANHRRLAQFAPLVRTSCEAPYLRPGEDAHRWLESGDEHKMILEAICARDGKSAERLARLHIRAASEYWTNTDGAARNGPSSAYNRSGRGIVPENNEGGRQ